MSDFQPQIITALSLRVAGIVLAAQIDEPTRTVRILQTGECLNGEAAAVAKALALLVGRVQRTRPDLRVI